MKISSTANPRVKKVCKLKHRKNRDLSRVTVVDGVREITRAREAGARLTEIYICPEILEASGNKELSQQAAGWGVPVFEVDKNVASKISFGERNEGIVALCAVSDRNLGELKLCKDSVIVVAEELEKPGNLGAILRTCDGAGVSAVVCVGARTDIYNPNVIRASIGAVFSVPVFTAGKTELLEYFKTKGISIMASSPYGKQSHWNTDMKGPLAIVLGSEGKGLTSFWLDNADIQVSIPMRGKADSLNVSATAAVLVYEAMRQRR